jgi:hypothetical protein
MRSGPPTDPTGLPIVVATASLDSVDADDVEVIGPQSRYHDRREASCR